MEISEPDFAAAGFGHCSLDTVAQRGIQLPKLGLPGPPGLFVLAQFCIGEVGPLEEEASPLLLDSFVEHLLHGRVRLFGHLSEALVRCWADANGCWHTNLYYIMAGIFVNKNVSLCLIAGSHQS